MRRWITWAALGAVAILSASFAVGSVTTRTMDAPGSADELKTARATGAMPFAPTADGDVAFMTQESAAGASSVRNDTVAAGYGDRIIRTTMLTIEVEEGTFDDAWEAANDLAITLGGEVLDVHRGDDQRFVPGGGDPALSGSITIRVPTARLEEATRRFATSIGELRTETTSSQDVTEEYVDLSARLRNLRAERAVLLTLFDRARTIRDTLSVQSRLGEVQGEIERVTGRIRFIERSTEFSTLTISIAEPGATILPTPGDDPSFARAWETALEGLVRILTGAMIGAVWLAPFAILAAAVLSWRRRRPPAPAAPTV